MRRQFLTTSATTLKERTEIGRLAEPDLPEAERICRLAFATFLEAPEPATFWTDRDYVHSRWRAPHTAALGARQAGALVGSNFATRWGSVGILGPLTIRPDLWDRGIAQDLLAATLARFDDWNIAHAGLFTFAHSAKHVGLYQKFGFAARFLTAIMAAPATRAGSGTAWQRYGALSPDQRQEMLQTTRSLTDQLFPGLDLSAEIETVREQELGDTVIITDGSDAAGFAICHFGPASEAGAGTCFIKFGAVRPGTRAERNFVHLLDACEALAVQVAMPTLLAGANLGRYEAYQYLLTRGFRTMLQGVTMHRPNQPGYSRPGMYVIDDWR
jgi:N-acetylglutamate synthase-like GNAT family acetyltransferase